MDGSGIDLADSHDLQIIEVGVFAEDRNGKANSLIHFSDGSAEAMTDFDPATCGFTIMVWIKFSLSFKFRYCENFRNR